MGKMVVLLGSVRRSGNTAMLVDAFVRGVGDRHVVEVLPVGDYTIRPCIGCDTCRDREGHACMEQTDDMHKIYTALTGADTVIVASPVYFFGLSAQLKTVIDRLHTPLRKTFGVRRLGLMAVGANPKSGTMGAVELEFQLALDYFHLESAGQVLVQGVRAPGEIAGHPGLQEAYAWGQSIE